MSANAALWTSPDTSPAITRIEGGEFVAVGIQKERAGSGG
jgi:hypothetical protein